jgi:hypothetical protein
MYELNGRSIMVAVIALMVNVNDVMNVDGMNDGVDVDEVMSPKEKRNCWGRQVDFNACCYGFQPRQRQTKNNIIRLLIF